MNARSMVSYAWRGGDVGRYTTGVSLHSHTSLSVESLTFIHKMFATSPWLAKLFAHYERRALERHGLRIDFVAAHWRPPLVPKMAYDLEHEQIEKLGLRPLVSITDHDDIQAPLLLRTIPLSRGIPVSLEWTVPFGQTVFHLGIHNLPSADGPAWMERLAAATEAASEEGSLGLLRELDSNPQVLIVMNHPLWDLYKRGRLHVEELERFLRVAGRTVHALELNGLRHAKENHEVMRLAKRWEQLLISGGDRHGVEPNANINLTNAQTFTEFVHEVRVERRSHVLFMEQYCRPWEQRIMNSTLDAVFDHAHFSPGWQRWDERAFHPDREGVMRPLSELWAGGRAPLPLRVSIAAIRLLRYRTAARGLEMVLPKVDVSGMELVETETW